MSKKGKVYIVGAGCGDFELLTLKGKRCISEADCIIYDRLVNKRILGFAGNKIIYLPWKRIQRADLFRKR